MKNGNTMAVVLEGGGGGGMGWRAEKGLGIKAKPPVR